MPGMGGPITTTVTIVLSAGFDEHHTVHTGDFSGDTLPDIYLKHTPDPVEQDETDVGDFGLVQLNGRTVLHYDFVRVVYDIAVGSKDYSGFHPGAIAFADIFGTSSGQIDEDVTPGSSTAIHLGQILTDALGIEVLNGQLEQTCTGRLAYDANDDFPCNSTLVGRLLTGLIGVLFSEAHAQSDLPVNTQLPYPTPGIHPYIPSSSTVPTSSTDHQYGTSATNQSVVNLGNRRQARYPNGPRIGIGDISLQGGAETDPHSGHRNGTTVDIRPMLTTGAEVAVGAYELNDAYDRQRTQELVDEIRKDPNVDFILFNDPQIQGVSASDSSHNNHLHVQYKR